MRNHGYTYTDTITRDEEGLCALHVYLGRYDHSDEQEWIEHFAQGRIVLNGTAASASTVVMRGDVLYYHRPPWDEPDVPDELPVLFEDASCVVFNKPSGLPVLPGGGFLQNTLLHLARQRHGATLSPVHRLGRGTSGAILFSRDAAAAALLGAAMRERRVEKTYLALAQGLPERDRFDITVPIGRVPHALLGQVFAAQPRGKASLSQCTVLHRDAEAEICVVAVRIPTGRPHQIRIHLAAAGHPLVGDPLYIAGGQPAPPDAEGNQAVPGDCGYHLHSWRLCFPSVLRPETVESVTAPPPEGPLAAWRDGSIPEEADGQVH